MLPRLIIVGTGLLFLRPLWCQAFDSAAALEFILRQPSIYCLDCHDGVLARQVHRGHATGTNYLLAHARAPAKLKPPGSLHPAVYLNGGEITCVTCHHPESTHDSKLVLSNAGSKLCLACHNQ